MASFLTSRDLVGAALVILTGDYGSLRVLHRDDANVPCAMPPQSGLRRSRTPSGSDKLDAALSSSCGKMSATAVTEAMAVLQQLTGAPSTQRPDEVPRGTPGLKPAVARSMPTPHRACRSSRVTPSRRPRGSSGTTVALCQIDDPVQSGGARAVGGSCPPDPDEGTDESVVGLIGSRTPRAQKCEKQRCHEVVQLGQSFEAPVCDLHQQVISMCCRPSGDEARGILRLSAIRMFLPNHGLRFLHASYPIGLRAPGFPRRRPAEAARGHSAPDDARRRSDPVPADTGVSAAGPARLIRE